MSCPARLLWRYTAGILGALALLLSVSTQAAPPRVILVLGDSISAAYGMSLEQGWVALAAAELGQDHPGYEVINASISGETSGGGLRRLPSLLAKHLPAVLILELGANDGLRGYPLSRLRGNLQQMIDLAEDAGARVLLLPMEIPPNYGSRYTTAFHNVFPQLASENNIALAPFLMAGVARNAALKQADGLHPTAAAQKLLLKNVMPALYQLIETL